MSVDPIEFLKTVHQRAEEIAQATTPVPRTGEWIASRDKHDEDDAPLALVQGRDDDEYDFMGENYRSGLPVIVLAAEWQDEAEANLRHIALHDPRSVLRRIAGERKTLDACTDILSAPDGWEYTDAPELAKAAVRNMAEGWGWTEEMA